MAASGGVREVKCTTLLPGAEGVHDGRETGVSNRVPAKSNTFGGGDHLPIGCRQKNPRPSGTKRRDQADCSQLGSGSEHREAAPTVAGLAPTPCRLAVPSARAVCGLRATARAGSGVELIFR